ncbi:MAG TPA: nucleoside deaminase [Gemmatimonadetes bacterium]|nr:nucleoside deaminase [Gemmatimonadota bacterium]
MEKAISQAQRAYDLGEVPVGALITRKGEVLSEAHNLTGSMNDPTAHAEVLAIRKASERLRDWRLVGCTLYTTLEPCAMCAGALVLSRIERLVFGAADPKSGMVGSLGNLVCDDRLNHRLEVTSGILQDESADLLRSYFKNRRS